VHPFKHPDKSATPSGLAVAVDESGQIAEIAIDIYRHIELQFGDTPQYLLRNQHRFQHVLIGNRVEPEQ